MTASLTLPGQACQVQAARRWLAGLVAGCLAADEIVLAASELAANAVSHSRSGEPGGTFTIRVGICPDLVRIEVTDDGGPWQAGLRCDRGLRRTGRGGSDLPARGAALADRAADGQGADHFGRGLVIVAGLTSAWGIDGDDVGRTAWCVLPAQAPPAAAPPRPPAATPRRSRAAAPPRPSAAAPPRSMCDASRNM